MLFLIKWIFSVISVSAHNIVSATLSVLFCLDQLNQYKAVICLWVHLSAFELFFCGYSSSLLYSHPCVTFSLCGQCESLTDRLFSQILGLECSVEQAGLPHKFVVELLLRMVGASKCHGLTKTAWSWRVNREQVDGNCTVKTDRGDSVECAPQTYSCVCVYDICTCVSVSCGRGLWSL